MDKMDDDKNPLPLGWQKGSLDLRVLANICGDLGDSDDVELRLLSATPVNVTRVTVQVDWVEL